MICLHNNMMLVAQIALVLVAYEVSSFTSTHSTYIRRTSSNTELYQFIKADSEEDVAVTVEENIGGVGLAKRCAIKCIGSVQSSSDGESEFNDLIRYDKLTSIDKSTVDKFDGVTILAFGEGKETYQDPGQSNRVEDRVIRLSPMEAIQQALSNVSNVNIEKDKSVTFNFLGGDDLILKEVIDASDMLANNLELDSKIKVAFNSISVADVPNDECSVTVVSSEGKTNGLTGVDESIARGEVYSMGGEWYTVSEEDVTTATD